MRFFWDDTSEMSIQPVTPFPALTLRTLRALTFYRWRKELLVWLVSVLQMDQTDWLFSVNSPLNQDNVLRRPR